MAKAMLENPEVAAYFIQIVQEFGGIDKVSWVNVARKLYNAFQFKECKSQKLKSVYEDITREKANLNQKEIGLVVQSYVEYRGECTKANERFKQLSKIDMVHSRYLQQAKQSLLVFVRDILQMFSRRKKNNFLPHKILLVQSILVMLRSSDLKDVIDPLVLEVQKCGIKLKTLLLTFAKISHLEQVVIFGEMHQLMNRYDSTLINYYICLIFELRQIYLNHYTEDDQLMNHPLLEKTIEKNKNSQIYKILIDKSDRNEKYNIYNNINMQDENPYTLEIDRIYPIKQQRFNRELQIQQVQPKKLKNENKFKLVRGQLRQEGDLQEKAWNTIVFENQDDDGEDDEQKV